jgi:hypothetical protein
MKYTASAVAATCQLLLAPVSALRGPLMFKGGMQVGPIDEVIDPVTILNGTLNGTYGWGTFDQLLDHSNPSLGTFKQRYWYGSQYWKGPGSPVIALTPGEQDATGFNVTYTGQNRLTGLYAKEVGGAVVVVEHRYWGQSSPFSVLSAANLTYLTLDNSIRDMTYFANNWVPPFDQSNKSHPSVAPWVFVGGSYPGALAGWIESVDPGTFWAYHGTSGVVEALSNFWTYWEPVRAATPQNCSTDLNLVINYVDSVLSTGTPEKKAALKHKFLMDGLEDADFGECVPAAGDICCTGLIADARLDIASSQAGQVCGRRRSSTPSLSSGRTSTTSSATTLRLVGLSLRDCECLLTALGCLAQLYQRGPWAERRRALSSAQGIHQVVHRDLSAGLYAHPSPGVDRH